jgi:hypothetical protein
MKLNLSQPHPKTSLSKFLSNPIKMEKRGKPSSAQLSSTLSPRWKSGSYNFKCTLTPNELTNSLSKKPTQKTELEHYKLRLGQKYKQSPIVKACRNIDEFYRSIRPLKSKFSTFKSTDQPLREKSDLLVSFYSKIDDEQFESLSQVFSRECLERFKELTNEFSVKQEDEMY